jgi:hypothetical protein
MGFCTRADTKLISGVFVKREKKKNVYVDPSVHKTYIYSFTMEKCGVVD